MGFMNMFGGEKPQRPEGRPNLGGDFVVDPESPNTDATEAANLTPEKIQKLIEEESANPNPDYERIAFLKRLLENKGVN